MNMGRFFIVALMLICCEIAALSQPGEKPKVNIGGALHALLTVAGLAKKNPKWVYYADYCLYREKGIRKQAFKKLDSFIELSNSCSSFQSDRL